MRSTLHRGGTAQRARNADNVHVFNMALTRMNRSRLLSAAALAVLFLVGAAAAWRASRGPQVPGYRVEPHALQQDVVATGTIITPSRIDVSSEITGLVVSREVERGEHVRAGQLLLRLRADQLDAQRRQAAAALRQLLQQGRPQARAALRSADAALQLARADASRARAQAAAGAVSRQQLEQAEQALSAAQQSVFAARAAWDASRRGGALEMQARAALAAADAARARAEIRALHAGVVLTRNVEVGDAVNPGQVLLTLAQDGPVEVSLPVDERNLEHLARGQHARCVTDAYPQRVLDATLDFIAPQVDTASGTVELRLRVSAPPAWLRQDMTTSCDIVTGRVERALVVPDDALRSRRGAHADVLVLDRGRARLRAVRLGLQGLVASEVASGLRAGDVVLDAPAVSAGQRVRALLRELPQVMAAGGATDAPAGAVR
jgi:HlyD family secretion protein